MQRNPQSSKQIKAAAVKVWQSIVKEEAQHMGMLMGSVIDCKGFSLKYFCFLKKATLCCSLVLGDHHSGQFRMFGVADFYAGRHSRHNPKGNLCLKY